MKTPRQRAEIWTEILLTERKQLMDEGKHPTHIEIDFDFATDLQTKFNNLIMEGEKLFGLEIVYKEWCVQVVAR